jgi:hypothetical protein
MGAVTPALPHAMNAAAPEGRPGGGSATVPERMKK